MHYRTNSSHCSSDLYNVLVHYRLHNAMAQHCENTTSSRHNIPTPTLSHSSESSAYKATGFPRPPPVSQSIGLTVDVSVIHPRQPQPTKPTGSAITFSLFTIDRNVIQPLELSHKHHIFHPTLITSSTLYSQMMSSSNNSPGRTSDRSAARQQHRRAQIIDNILHEQAAQVNASHSLNMLVRQHSADATATRYELTISNLSGRHTEGATVSALDDMYRQREQAHGAQSSSTGEDSSPPVVSHTHVIAQPSLTGVESLLSVDQDAQRDAQATAYISTPDQHHDSHSQSSRDSYVDTDSRPSGHCQRP
jgi:hypothetical protein